MRIVHLENGVNRLKHHSCSHLRPRNRVLHVLFVVSSGLFYNVDIINREGGVNR